MEDFVKENNRNQWQDVMIENSAHVDKDCSIGPGTKIWAGTHIGEYCIIGANVIIGQNVYVGPGSEIGDNCRIQNFVSIPEECILKEGVFMGSGSCLTNVRYARAMINKRHAFIGVRVGKGSTIGANAVIVSGCDLGRYSMIEEGAVVKSPVNPFSVQRGNPSHHVGWISEKGILQDNRPGI